MKKTRLKNKLVYLGMSGGVDSSVSAALLKRDGYEVVGVFIKVWELENVPCTWRAERRDAMRVAACLDIPLLTLDLSREYKKGVIDYLVAEYKKGRTPNPDVMCNKQIKFGAFYNWAMERGADFVATGHYARLRHCDTNLRMHANNTNESDSRHSSELFADSCRVLVRSKDEAKDQTYFLWNLKAKQLEHILFPIGHLTKPEVRKLAEKFKLPNAEKRDSQGLCFVGQIDFKDFLAERLKLKPGKVLDKQGEVIGHHDGAALYTIGERHGFVLDHQTPQESPHFVIARDISTNTITVSQNVRSLTSHSGDVLKLEQVNWIGGELKAESRQLKARIRHRGELYPCKLFHQGPSLMVEFLKEPTAPASGQSLVLYDGDVCLGGGIIA